MAAPKKPLDSVAVNAQKALADVKARFREADAVRDKAKTLLRPNDILDGKQDANRLAQYLTRNRDGSYRPITIEDVVRFDSQRSQLEKKHQKGITAKEIIDLSAAIVPHQHASAVKKAREQIKTAIPIATSGGELKFATNTGPHSKRDRHYVTVKMLNFESAVAAAADPAKIAKKVTEGPVAIGCSCEDFRYTFSYLVTVAGANLPSHRENAVPKIRNATLTGFGCKHIVKVASVLIQSPSVRNYVARLIEVERNKTQTKLKREAIAVQRELEQEMVKESHRQRTIKTTEEKRAQRAAQPAQQRKAAEKAAKAAQAVKKDAVKAIQRHAAKKTPKQAAIQISRSVAELEKQGGDKQAIIAALLAEAARLQGAK
jgi:hypothetical protein